MLYQDMCETHIPELAELYVRTFNAPPWNDRWTVSLARQRLHEMIDAPNAFGLVCYADERTILGMIVGHGETYYDCKLFFIQDFFVIPSKQGQGIGTSLMAEFEGRLKRRGIEKTYLFTSREDQTEQYYQKRGYKSWNDMVLMGKSIN